MIDLSELTAIGPIDGRYRSKCAELAQFLSEYGLIKYRVIIEVEYFIQLANQILPSEDVKRVKNAADFLKQKAYELDILDALKVKDFEATTNHDVKAVEYYVKILLKEAGLEDLKEWVHFGLTSQDINNTAIPLSIKHTMQLLYLPILENVIREIDQQADNWMHIPMLARTHGQPASPTTLGKEWKVFSVRLKEQLRQLNEIPVSCKFGGATGNLNAHYIAYPDIDWHSFSDAFVGYLGMKRSSPTTQIEHYDNLAAMCDALKRINTILIDFSRDVWTYVSMDYFKQKIKAGEVGSSAMPHKVNPIDFENAEGNLGMANSLFEFLAGKLPVSRLQRDLTDSTVLRNIGVPFGHSLIAFSSLIKGMNKLLLNEEKINSDLDNNWAVVAEALQTILRRERYSNPYETLKELTRTNTKITKDSLHLFVDSLIIPENVKAEMKNITPHNYIGKVK
jgi:adenylosuccinate lyase